MCKFKSLHFHQLNKLFIGIIMEEEISSELREKIQKNVEKVFEKLIEKASKGESLEGLIKSLIVEKIMNILGALMKRTVAKKMVK